MAKREPVDYSETNNDDFHVNMSNCNICPKTSSQMEEIL